MPRAPGRPGRPPGRVSELERVERGRMVRAETEQARNGFGPESRWRRKSCGLGRLREELGAVGELECSHKPGVESGHRDLRRARRARRGGLGMHQARDDGLELSAGERIFGSRCRRLGHYSGGDYGLELGPCPRCPRLGGGCCRRQREEHDERADVRKAAAAHLCPIGGPPYLFNLQAWTSKSRQNPPTRSAAPSST